MTKYQTPKLSRLGSLRDLTAKSSQGQASWSFQSSWQFSSQSSQGGQHENH